MDISIRRGETLQIPITADDSTATHVDLIVIDEDDVLLNISTNFEEVNKKTVANIKEDSINLPIGEYQYMLVMHYEDNIIDILPDVGNCQDCDLPKFSVCRGIN